GRVTKEDVLRYVEQGGRRAAPATPAAPGGAPRRSEDAGSFSWAEFHSHVEHPEVAIGAGDGGEPMNRLTPLIAAHMVRSRRSSAHVHSYFEVDYSRIDQVRARNRTVWEEQGLKVTYTAFLVRAVSQALREFPVINAAISGDRVVYRGEVNVG